MPALTPKGKEKLGEICGYTGAFGAIIAAVALVQLMVYGLSHWLAYVLAVFYCLVIVVYLLLGLKKPYAPLLLIITAALSAADVLAMFIFHAISLIVLVQLLYTTVVAIVFYMEGYAGQLQLLAMDKAQEEAEWKDKI